MKPIDSERRLILVRHAKSSWKHQDLEDFDRPLNKRGMSDGPIMAKHMAKKISRPDLILCSDSRRTRDTTVFICDALGLNTHHIAFEPRLYLTGVDTMVNCIAGVEDSVQTLMVVAHNPGITDLHNKLAMREFLDNIPTFGVVEIALSLPSWQDILKLPPGKRLAHLCPKMLK